MKAIPRFTQLLLCLLLLPTAARGASGRPPHPKILLSKTPPAFASDVLPETEEVEHGTEGKLAGAPVLSNGLISVAVAPGGLLLFSHDEKGKPTLRARLRLQDAKGPADEFRSAAVKEHGRTTVGVTVNWSGPTGEITARVQLQRGHATVEIAPVKNLRACRYVGPDPSFLVVPAFYGDDFLLAPSDLPPGDVFVPSEYLVLWLTGGGEAIVQAVWNPADPDDDNTSDTIVQTTVEADGDAKTLATTELTFGNKSLFFATWEAEGLWRNVEVDDRFGDFASGKTKDVKLAWNPPYEARWQAIVHGPDHYTSWGLKDRRSKGLIGAHGIEVEYTWPFWRHKGAYYLHLPPGAIQKVPPENVIIYPLKRTGRTPSHVKLPDDILKESLKTGVCEHLFRSGGGGGNPIGPLCVLIGRFHILARLYAGTGRASELLRKHADWIYEQGEQQYRRLREYKAFGEAVLDLCERTREAQPDLADEIEPIRKHAEQIVAACDKVIAAGAAMRHGFRDFRPATDDPVKAMKALHGELVASLDRKAPNVLALWNDLVHKLHGMAVRPQGALPRPRALTRLIQNEATRLAVAGPAAAVFAKEVRTKAQDVLRSKHWAEQGR